MAKVKQKITIIKTRSRVKKIDDNYKVCGLCKGSGKVKA